MKTIDEEIWDYLDGNMGAGEKAETAAKINSDPLYQQTYTELLQVQHLLQQNSPEEPSLSFTRNVMEQVKLEIAPVALKTRVNHKVIYAISAFFLLSILCLFIYALAGSNFSEENFKMPSIRIAIDIDSALKSTSLRLFLFIDLVLALIYLDGFLRQKKA